jgi:endonuclease III
MMPENAVRQHSGLVPGKDVHAADGRLMKIAPDVLKLDIHHWPILHRRSCAQGAGRNALDA